MKEAGFPRVKVELAFTLFKPLIVVVEAAVAILAVEHQRVANHGEVFADLMFAAGLNAYFQ